MKKQSIANNRQTSVLMVDNNKNKKKITLVFIIIALIIVCILSFFIFKHISDTHIAKQKEKEVSERIEKCISSTKKDLLGFVTNCYENEGKAVPNDVLMKDKERVDRILAQSDYDLCMANASFQRDSLWDLNDRDPQNGSAEDPMSRHLVNFVQKAYDQDVDECKSRYKLKGDYEEGFKTVYMKKLVGWKNPKSNKIPIIDRYNANGRIEEGSGLSGDEDVPNSVASVGFIIASKFKENHTDLWY